MPETHITCVMPTTAARRAFIPWACRWFLEQDHIDADLLVVGDSSTASVADLVPVHDRIRYVHLENPDGMPLGRKYNACVARAQGPLVALWADDDWPAPSKLSMLLEALAERPRALIAGARSMLFHRLGTGKTWAYDKPGPRVTPYFLGGSILFHMDYWRRVRQFSNEARRSADASFTNSLSRKEYAELAAVVPRYLALGSYVATIHPTNTGRADADPAGPGWSPWPGDLAELMGPAYALWQQGGAICERIGASRIEATGR